MVANASNDPPTAEQSAQYYVGVKIKPDGSRDYSHAASWLGPQLGKGAEEVHASASKDQLAEVPMPANWTYLVHGTNLDRSQWTKERKAMLDQDTFVISLGLGLSTVENSVAEYRQKEELKSLQSQGIASNGFDTSRDYARGDGQVVEIRVIFPKLNSRDLSSQVGVEELIAKYGEKKIKELMQLTDQVYFNNIQAGRHPLLPRDMVLVKKQDQIKDGKRIIYYVPQQLLALYEQEIGQIA
jgi:hypothetical protein